MGTKLKPGQIEEPENQVCFWIRDSDSGAYDTECDQAFFFDSGDVQENNFAFCPFCGERIQVITEDDEE